ncbi:hypothetical protein D9M68_601290 [compost metagenome]
MLGIEWGNGERGFGGRGWGADDCALAVLGAIDVQFQHVVVGVEQLRHLTDQFVPDPSDGEAVGLRIEGSEDVVEQRVELDAEGLQTGVFLPGELGGLAQHR